MKTIVMDTGKDVVTFKVSGTEVRITASMIPTEFVANPKTFKDQANTERNLKILRRSKGEKFYWEWKGDLEKFGAFKTEEEIVEDIMEDFHKKRGWRLLNE